jgi:hypothetical protein
MSELRVWFSILAWAALAVLAAWLTQRMLFSLYPHIHAGVVSLAAMTAVFAVYGMRSTARHLELVRKSYASADHPE